MKLFGLEIRRNRTESRAIAAENPAIPVSAENFIAAFGISSTNIPAVTVDSALQVPAVMCAVAFLSRTLAGLDLFAYRRDGDTLAKMDPKEKLQIVINENPNDEMGSFKFRQHFWQGVFTGGRGVAWIERNGQNLEALWPLDPTLTTIHRDGRGRTVYRYGGQEYPAADIIDVPFMLRPNMLQHYGPIQLAAKAIQLALAMNDYASGFFAGGGVPPLALVGPMPSNAATMQRTMNDVAATIKAAKDTDKPIFPMPPGFDLKPVGFDPEKGQMTDARRFQIEEIARGWQLPPVFLQDLSHGTYTNTEQQDLHFVKHLVKQWAEAFEDELNLKIFGRMNNNRVIRHDLDDLMRGDFVSRMAGFSQAIQAGLLTPNEGRERLQRPAHKGGEQLFIQSGTVPIEQAGQKPQGTANDTGNPDPQGQA